MKALRIALPVVLILVTSAAFSKSGPNPDTAPANIEARQSFKKLKALVGSWDSDNPKKPLHITFRLTSNGNSILSEMYDDKDNMITMFHLDDGKLMLTHYCAAGNQPRMVGKLLPDGKTVQFDFLDGTNFASRPDGHMHGMILTLTDDNHHSEDFIFQTKDGTKLVPVHFNLHRTE